MVDEQEQCGGRFRRLIDLSRRDACTVVGWLEDDVHHFGVTVTHDRDKVVEVAVATVRFPYTTCGAAGIPFRAIVGTPLFERAADIGQVVDMRRQCTHLFDLAGLLVAFASVQRPHRRFEAVVEDRSFVGLNAAGRRVMGEGEARLFQDGDLVQHWRIDGQTIIRPEAWAGWPLMDGFRARSEDLDVTAAEQAFVLRRAIMVSNGRTATQYPLPRDRGWPGVCHTFQPDQRDYAERIDGMRRNYEASDEGMLAHRDKMPR